MIDFSFLDPELVREYREAKRDMNNVQVLSCTYNVLLTALANRVFARFMDAEEQVELATFKHLEKKYAGR